MLITQRTRALEIATDDLDPAEATGSLLASPSAKEAFHVAQQQVRVVLLWKFDLISFLEPTLSWGEKGLVVPVLRLYG